MKPKDTHRKHQQLMTQLDICLGRIRAHEGTMRRKKGKLPPHDWEHLVRALNGLVKERNRINKEIGNLRHHD